MQTAQSYGTQSLTLVGREEYFAANYMGRGMIDEYKIAVIGQGYVGLPLALAFGAKFSTVGFDIDAQRISELQGGVDSTLEAEPADFKKALNLSFSANLEDIRDCNIYIVAVPTPVDSSMRPNLAPLIAASKTISAVLSPGNVVIYESTVFPGATEEICVPVIEKLTSFKMNTDFFVGYSPERINPGDKTRPLASIKKVTSGSTAECARFIDDLYKSIITAGTHLATSIRVAEASKVIENTQRDVNIALMNELSIVFSHLGIDTHEVLDAAATKWNFVRLEPGLVGGHCIGVDPYYLIHRSAIAGHIPDIIRKSREINDGMARHAARLLFKTMAKNGAMIAGSRILILGATFKEDCPDTRNSKIVDLYAAISEWGGLVDVHDPWADAAAFHEEYGLQITKTDLADETYDAVVLAVKHKEYLGIGAAGIRRMIKKGGVFFDMKSAFARGDSDLRL